MKKILYALSFIVSFCFMNNANAMEGAECPDYKVLVAYFSATGNTAKVAEEIYKTSTEYSVETDLFEIKPEQPYTDADLDWHNDQSRSSIEMKDKTSRPKIATSVENMDKYDVVFVGFPIWWGREPAIIDTFIESYNFSGKHIVPFVTSGSSDIGDTYKNIKALAPDADVDEGNRFSANMSQEEKSELDLWTFGYIMPVCPDTMN